MDTDIPPPAATTRLMSLDVLRGFDMFWIIGGHWLLRGLAEGTQSPFLKDLLPQLRHVDWEGFRFIDLIMPLFLFIVGAAMPFSFAKRQSLGMSTRRIYLHVAVRVVVLFVLGMIAQGNLLRYNLSKLHIYCNTLQAIAAGYLIASVLILHLRIRWQMLAVAAILLVFWALMAWVPVPDFGPGVLTEEGNLAICVDKRVLGRFQDGTPYTWILSSMNFGATVMLGVFAGEMLRSSRTGGEKFLLLVAAGVACYFAGKLWGNAFPIIKHIWTSSFVLYSGGMCYLLLAFFYLVIDVCKLRRWAFIFVVIGMNAIAVYMATELYDFRNIGDIFVKNLRPWLGRWHEFVRALAGFGVVWLILWWMYRKKSFIKI